MMNFINSIPNSVGWIMVGILGTLVVLMGGLLIRTIVQMVREYRAEAFITYYEEEK